ncbi:MAG: ABC transporter ATP-binding protein [Vicinamibacterales bacterium]
MSFCVRPGGWSAISGPNGSGKSTTTKLLTGLLEPDEGFVRPIAKTLRTTLFHRRRLGYVPEEPQLYAFQSPTEYLELIANLRELPRQTYAGRTAAMLELFGLSQAADQAMSTFSKGMKQKVMIIAALLHNPDVVILDEPDSGLDTTATLVLRHLLGELAKRGKCVLYSSHVLDLVEKSCSRVIVLDRGRIVADGTLQTLRAQTERSSLEGVLATLSRQVDPAKTAADIADIVTAHA